MFYTRCCQRLAMPEMFEKSPDARRIGALTFLPESRLFLDGSTANAALGSTSLKVQKG
jgi:hypothetical protein